MIHGGLEDKLECELVHGGLEYVHSRCELARGGLVHDELEGKLAYELVRDELGFHSRCGLVHGGRVHVRSLNVLF